jgi:outer membrane protein assembly factor BamD (BamD/ComL family)
MGYSSCCNAAVQGKEEIRGGWKMVRFRFIFAVAGWLLPFVAFGQVSEEDMLALLEKNDLATAREKVTQAYRQHPSSATAAYFHALLQDKAENAVKLFQEISTRFRGTVYAERALFRLGQYHFADGTYQQARQYFLNLLEQYPASNLAPQAAYYAAKSLLVIGNSPQIREELSRCIAKYPGTWMAKFAAEDLVRLQMPANHKTSEPAKKKPPAEYAVQVGAYSQRENAASQLLIFSKAGYAAEIKEKSEGRRVYYLVHVGEFADRNQARAFADEIQRKHKLRCNVVKREE